MAEELGARATHKGRGGLPGGGSRGLPPAAVQDKEPAAQPLTSVSPAPKGTGPIPGAFGPTGPSHRPARCPHGPLPGTRPHPHRQDPLVRRARVPDGIRLHPDRRPRPHLLRAVPGRRLPPLLPRRRMIVDAPCPAAPPGAPPSESTDLGRAVGLRRDHIAGPATASRSDCSWRVRRSWEGSRARPGHPRRCRGGRDRSAAVAR